jgi:hypothetical protein
MMNCEWREREGNKLVSIQCWIDAAAAMWTIKHINPDLICKLVGSKHQKKRVISGSCEII